MKKSVMLRADAQQLYNRVDARQLCNSMDINHVMLHHVSCNT